MQNVALLVLILLKKIADYPTNVMTHTSNIIRKHFSNIRNGKYNFIENLYTCNFLSNAAVCARS